IGASAAEKIWYRGLTVYMTASTNFAGARTATLNAAADLFGNGSTQYNTVAQAWCACGVGSCNSTPPPPPPPPPPTGSELIVNGGFETSVTSAAPWSVSGNASLVSTTNGTGGLPPPRPQQRFPHNADNASGTAFQQITIPSGTSPNLTFWLNITSQETTTSTQYDKLFIEVRNSSGTLLSTLGIYSNLSKGTAGVYSQKSFSLASFAGQTVRV